MFHTTQKESLTFHMAELHTIEKNYQKKVDYLRTKN